MNAFGRAPTAPIRALPQAFDHATDAEEAVEVGVKAGLRRVHGVQSGERKWVAVLPQHVADGNLAAEGIAAPCHVQTVQIVGKGLDQNRHPESGELQGIGHALFVAEIGQRDHDAVDAIALRAKQFGAARGVGPGLDRAEFRLLLGEDHGFDAERLQCGENLAPPFRNEVIGKEVAVANDHCATHRCHDV